MQSQPNHASSLADAHKERLLQLSQTLSTATAMFHQMAAETYGLGITDMKTLGILLQEGAMSAGHIAQRLGVTTGAVTNVIDKLEQRKLVTRQADPHDRRKVIVAPNRTKIAAQSNVYESIGKAFAALLERYTPEELALLVRFHQEVISMTESEVTKLAQMNASSRQKP